MSPDVAGFPRNARLAKFKPKACSYILLRQTSIILLSD